MVLVFGVAVLLGLLLHRVEVRRGLIDDRDRRLVGDGMSSALGFIGGAAAFLLGVLMLTSMDHYHATEDAVDAEAISYAAAYANVEGLAVPDQAKIQRDLACLMRSVATNSWSETQKGNVAGSRETHAWRARVRDDVNAVEPKTAGQENSLSSLQSELVDAAKSGQQRLLSAEDHLPTVLWILVYVSVFVLTTTLTLLLVPYPMLAVTTLTAVLVLSAAMVWTLTAFAQPFTEGDGVFISPRSLNAVLARMQDTNPDADWGPCEQLRAS